MLAYRGSLMMKNKMVYHESGSYSKEIRDWLILFYNRIRQIILTGYLIIKLYLNPHLTKRTMVFTEARIQLHPEKANANVFCTYAMLNPEFFILFPWNQPYEV